MNDQTSSERSRRRLIRALAGGGSVLLGAKGMPKKWSRPVLESLVLPVHAQLTTEELPPPPDDTISFTMSCSGSPSEGTPLSLPVNISLTYQATPNPGELPGELDVICDGAIDSTITIFSLDSAGELPLLVVGSQCMAGELLTIRFTVSGVSAECSWPILPEEEVAEPSLLEIRVLR